MSTFTAIVMNAISKDSIQKVIGLTLLLAISYFACLALMFATLGLFTRMAGCR